MSFAFVVFPGFPFFDSRDVSGPDGFARFLPLFFLVVFPAMMITGIVQLGLQAFYLIHIVTNKAITDMTRVLFALGAFFMPIIAMPLYFFLYVWPESPQGWSLRPSEENFQASHQ